MDFSTLFSFLGDLQENNHKEWMDANRKRYHELRDDFISWLDMLNAELEEKDAAYFSTPGKRGINRIILKIFINNVETIFLFSCLTVLDFYLHPY